MQVNFAKVSNLLIQNNIHLKPIGRLRPLTAKFAHLTGTLLAHIEQMGSDGRIWRKTMANNASIHPVLKAVLKPPWSSQGDRSKWWPVHRFTQSMSAFLHRWFLHYVSGLKQRRLPKFPLRVLLRANDLNSSIKAMHCGFLTAVKFLN